MATGVQGVISLSAVGQSSWVPINLNQFHFGVGLLTTLILGNATAGQINFGCVVTGDRLTSAITHQNLHDVLQNLTASTNDSLRYPCSAIALVVNSIGNTVNWTGSVTLAVVQTGSM